MKKKIDGLIKEAYKKLDIKEMYAYFIQRLIGQDDIIKKFILKVCKYLTAIIKGNRIKCNFFLCGPSGSGKTELYRTLRDYFIMIKMPIPVIQYDVSKLTPNGFEGDSIDSLAKKILNSMTESGNDGYAIVVLDEIDKIVVSQGDSYTAEHNEAVQSQMLTLVEGTAFHIGEECRLYNSTKTLFIGAGAFQNCRKNTTVNNSKKMGFLAEIVEDNHQKSGVYRELTLEDMINAGMKEELAGRFQEVLNMLPIPKKEKHRLLKLKLDEVGEELGLHICCNKKAELKLLEVLNGPMGVRELMKTISNLAMSAECEYVFSGGTSEALEIVIEDIDKAHALELNTHNEKLVEKEV